MLSTRVLKFTRSSPAFLVREMKLRVLHALTNSRAAACIFPFVALYRASCLQ